MTLQNEKSSLPVRSELVRYLKGLRKSGSDAVAAVEAEAFAAHAAAELTAAEAANTAAELTAAEATAIPTVATVAAVPAIPAVAKLAVGNGGKSKNESRLQAAVVERSRLWSCQRTRTESESSLARSVILKHEEQGRSQP